MLCASAHCTKDPSKAKRFPTKVCPTSLAPCLSPLGHKPLKTNSTTSLEPIVSLDTDSPRTSKLCPVPQLVLKVLFSQFQSRFMCSPNVVLSLCRLHPLECPRLLTSICLRYSRCLTHFFVVIEQFLPLAVFNSFVDRLAKSVPISFYQGRSSPVLRNVINIVTRFLASTFLCSQRQFLGTSP